MCDIEQTDRLACIVSNCTQASACFLNTTSLGPAPWLEVLVIYS